MATFVEERLALDAPDAREPKALVFEAYTFWCKTNGETPLTREALSKRLQARGLTEAKSNSTRYWKGATLRTRGTPLPVPAAA